jgi:hypothetical protein
MPILADAGSAGIFSIAFRDKDHAMIVGCGYHVRKAPRNEHN